MKYVWPFVVSGDRQSGFCGALCSKALLIFFDRSMSSWWLQMPWIQICIPSHQQPSWGGGYWANSLRSVIFQIFQSYHNTVYLWNVTFIFGRCRRSLAAVISAKYGCDLKVLTCAFAWSKFFLLEKLTNGALVTPTSGGSTVISVLYTLFLHNQPWIWP